MKIKHATLKSVQIATQFGTFLVDKDGIVDVPDEAADVLLQDNSFTKVESSKKEKESKDKEAKESK